ncbi:N-acetyltransferase [Clostridium estertheticum]|uniref:GNAT family N-acetyltransferase n=1 Tax=Clostridium estertheticum TaxID=238834 RepID=UPI0013E91180|nr:GNAT family N-acetyltransferase [Clostridium estertheticum]MBZ9685858.1 N-acetyltransferase [Clostridium estertheticum]
MIEIKKGKKSFYVGDNEEDSLAKIELVHNGDDITIEHTFVSEQLRGQNVARQLLKTVVDFAREKNKKIIPICTFAKAELNKNNDYEDVLHK